MPCWQRLLFHFSTEFARLAYRGDKKCRPTIERREKDIKDIKMSNNNISLTTVKPGEIFTSTGGIEDIVKKSIRVCQAVQTAVLVFTMWILLSAIIYGYKTKKWRERPESNSLDQGKMYSCCVAAIALTLPKLMITAVILFMHPDVLSRICEVMMDISTVLYFIATYPAYFYLWLRQRAIYSHLAARKLAGKCVILFGWAVLLLLSGLSFASLWAYVAPDAYVGTPTGCVPDSDDHTNWLFALAALLTVAQVSFLALFIYPMICYELDHMKKYRGPGYIFQDVASDVDETCRAKMQRALKICRQILCGDRDSGRDSSLVRTTRQSVYGALIAITTDLMAMVVASFVMPVSTPRNISDPLYDVSILINSLCILSTFGNNRKILSVFWSLPTFHSGKIKESTQI